VAELLLALAAEAADVEGCTVVEDGGAAVEVDGVAVEDGSYTKLDEFFSRTELSGAVRFPVTSQAIKEMVGHTLVELGGTEKTGLDLDVKATKVE